MRHIYYTFVSETPSRKVELYLLVIVPAAIMTFYLASLAPSTLIQPVNHLAQYSRVQETVNTHKHWYFVGEYQCRHVEVRLYELWVPCCLDRALIPNMAGNGS